MLEVHAILQRQRCNENITKKTGTLSDAYTNAAAEAFNAKIKAFRASFRGVVDMSFFLFRLAKVYA